MLDTITRDYISYGNLYNVLFLLFMIIVLYLAWLTTCISPLDYRIWVTQIFSYNTHRLVQVHNLSRQNIRHLFWRSPFTVNHAPQISTLVIVQRPAELNYPYTRNVPFSFFGETDSSNPDAPDEEQQIQIVDFISESIEAELHNNAMDDDAVVIPQPPPSDDSHRWRALAEIVQQAHVRHSGDSNDSVTREQYSFSSSTDNSTSNHSSSFSSSGATADQTILASSQPRHPAPMSSDTLASEENDVNIKLKHPDDSIKIVKTKLSTNVSIFKSQSFGDEAQLTKLIFQGKSLTDESQSLKFYGLFDDCVVHYITEVTNDVEESITVRLKHLDDRIVLAQLRPDVTVGDFKKLHFAQDLDAGKVIRLIFQGQLLRNDSRTLTSYGIVEQSVIHVHIGQRAYRQEGTNQQQPQVQNLNDAAEIFANPHLVVTGIAWLDSALLTFLSSILFIVRWAEADDVLEDHSLSLFSRLSRYLRLSIRFLTNLIAFMIVPQDNDVEMHHQFGAFFNFFVVLKIVIIISVSFFFPQVVDLKTIFLIFLISGFALMFLWANRARPRAA